MGEHQLYTLNQAAEATGLTVDALRQRIKRGKLRSFRGNDGRVMLRLDATELDALKPGPSDQPATSQLHSRLGEVSTLRDALDRERERVDQQQTELVELRAELATRQARLEHVKAELTTARVQVETEVAQRVRAHEALGQAVERLTEAVEATRATRRELDAWTAGGPLTRAWRALRGRD